MLDFIIYISFFVMFFFTWFGLTKKTSIGYFLGALFSVIIAIGLFSTGWQTYSAPTFTITQSGSTTTVTQTPLTILADLNGTMEQRTIFGLASFLSVLTLVFIFGGINERRKNVAISDY